MKTRFSSLDLQTIVAELRPKVTGLRVANIYDINQKTYILKLTQRAEKVNLLFESGARLHATSYDWTKSDFPSGFTMKCRKHLRGKHVTDIIQLGVDRVVDISIGRDTGGFHLIIELYDKGNVILTNEAYVILALLRTRTNTDKVRYAVNERYPIEHSKQPHPVTDERVAKAFAKAKEGDPLRRFLNPIMDCGPELIEHALLTHNFAPNACYGTTYNPDQDLGRVVAAMKDAETTLAKKFAQQEVKGYILMKSQAQLEKMGGAGVESDLFADVMPFVFAQHKDKSCREFPTFNEAVDTFFSEIEGQKLRIRAIQQEQSALKKIADARKKHENKIQAFQETLELDEHKATLIQLNQGLVDNAREIINTMLSNHLDWLEIEDLVKEAKSRGDPVASAISSLKLKQNAIIMVLTDPTAASATSEDDWSDDDDDDDDNDGGGEGSGDDKKAKAWKVNIDLNLTAHANATKYHQHKKVVRDKATKAERVTEKAMKSTEKKSMQDLKRKQIKANVTKVRQSFWFEKFYWFISSENYLVIAGRDKLQNEVIVSRYMKEGDVFVHADADGGSNVLIKNSNPLMEIPPITLTEAAIMAVVHSPWWVSNCKGGSASPSIDAWWVRPSQIHKQDANGKRLKNGDVHVIGARNFVQTGPITLGFSFLFMADDACIGRHADERRPKGLVPLDPSLQAYKEAAEGAGHERRSDHLQSDHPKHQDDGESAEGDADSTSDHGDGDGDGDGDVFRNLSLSYSYSADTVGASLTTGETLAVGSHDPFAASKEANGQRHVRVSEADDAEGKKRMSAKERRKMKKNKKKGTAKALTELSETQDERKRVKEAEQARAAQGPDVRTGSTHQSGEKPTSADGAATGRPSRMSSTSSSISNTAGPATGAGRRKKKAKSKRDKYADQDDEDRALMSELLGLDGVHKSRKEKRKERRQKGKVGSKQPKAAQGAQGTSLPDDFDVSTLARNTDKLTDLILSREPTEEPSAHGDDVVEENHEDAVSMTETAPENVESAGVDALDGDGNGDGDGDDDDKGEEVEKGVEKNEEQDSEEGEDDDEEEDKVDMDLSMLDKLTLQPFSNDDLLFSLAFVAPYSTIAHSVYKAKLVPGLTKKGKAARSIVQKLTSGYKLGKLNTIDLIKAMKDTDIHSCLPTKVKVLSIKDTKPKAYSAAGNNASE